MYSIIGKTIWRTFTTTAIRGKKNMKLFTPGPVNTTKEVKTAMLYDMGLSEERSRKNMEFLRSNIVKIACDTLSPKLYTAIPLQGSGTFAMEAAVCLATPLKKAKALILYNGFFGKNFVHICDKLKITFDSLVFPLGTPIDPDRVERHLLQHRDYTTLAMVHHETSSSVVNPLHDIAMLRKKYMPTSIFVVDAVSSYGCYPLDMDALNIDYLMMTPNKCLEGVPGCAFLIANKELMLKSRDNVRSYAFDLIDEFEELAETNVMRFTQPTNVLLACEQAIREYLKETMKKRNQRYKINNEIIRKGMTKLGFKPFVASNIKTSFLLNAFVWPNHPKFDFMQYQRSLEKKGIFVYPESLTSPKVFRVGNMGQLTPGDCRRLLANTQRIMKKLKVPVPMSDISSIAINGAEPRLV